MLDSGLFPQALNLGTPLSSYFPPKLACACSEETLGDSRKGGVMQAQGTSGGRPFLKAKVHISFSNVRVYGPVPHPTPTLPDVCPALSTPFPTNCPTIPSHTTTSATKNSKQEAGIQALFMSWQALSRQKLPTSDPRLYPQGSARRNIEQGWVDRPSPSEAAGKLFLRYSPETQTGQPGMPTSFPANWGASGLEVSFCFSVCLCPSCPLHSPSTSLSCSLACQNSLLHS